MARLQPSRRYLVLLVMLPLARSLFWRLNCTVFRQNRDPAALTVLARIDAVRDSGSDRLLNCLLSVLDQWLWRRRLQCTAQRKS